MPETYARVATCNGVAASYSASDGVGSGWVTGAAR